MLLSLVTRRVGIAAVPFVLAASFSGAPGVAAATAPAATMIVLQPVPVSYGHMQTTVQGVLETQNATPSLRQPVAGETIAVSLTAHDGTTTALGTATTASDGTFSLAVTLPALGLVRAAFAGDSAYAAINSVRYASAAALPSRVTLDPLPASINGLTYLTVTGSAQMQAPDGTWIPAADAYISVHGTTANYRANTETDGNGQFSVGFWVEDQGPFEVDISHGFYSFAGTSQSPGVPVTISPTPTQVLKFRPGATPGIAQNGLTFTTHIDAWATNNGSSFWTGGVGPADLYFQATGQTTWTKMATSYVYFPDMAGFAVPAYLPDGHLAEGSWQVRFPATPAFQGSESAVITLPVRIETWLTGVGLTTAGTAHLLAGTLDDEPTSGPLASQPVKLYYRYKGTATWHYSKTATTGANGSFTLKLPAGHRWWEAVFPATGNYLGVTSAGFYH